MEVTRRPGLAEVLLAWTLLALVGAAVFTTYARLPASDLYHVSGSGLGGGASRLVVFLGWPGGLVAIAVLAIVADRLHGALLRLAALVAAGLCASIVVPGVIDQADLDARPVNALAAAGVAAALALTAFALARAGIGRPAPLGRLDFLRVGLALVLLLAAIPWIAAELGFTVSDAPVLGSVFMGDQRIEAPGQETLMAVHLGDHHGMVGTLLAWVALALSRVPAQMRSAGLRAFLVAYLALMLVYGLTNAVQDFWLEQIVKRGATSVAVPGVIRPDATWAWAALLAVALLICVVGLRVVRVDQREEGGLR
jgi:hypothetical protein